MEFSEIKAGGGSGVEAGTAAALEGSSECWRSVCARCARPWGAAPPEGVTEAATEAAADPPQAARMPPPSRRNALPALTIDCASMPRPGWLASSFMPSGERSMASSTPATLPPAACAAAPRFGRWPSLPAAPGLAATMERPETAALLPQPAAARV